MELTALVSAFTHAALTEAARIAVASAWQGALIACGLAIILRFAPRASAEHRFTIWAAAFATIVSLPLLAVLERLWSTAVGGVSGVASVAGAGTLLSRPLVSMDVRWGVAIGALWAVAALVRACDLALHSFRLRKLWKDATPVEVDGGLRSLLTSAGSMWRSAPVEICTTSTLERPSVIGFLKPRILIPDWLFARLTAGELEQIVLHEAEHLRRRDDWTNLFQKLCLVLFPLNPALAWIERRLCREREMACDEGVVRITHAPRAYASCLARLAERGLERRAEALSLGAWQRRPELVHRVHSILGSKRTLGPLGTRALLGALGCGLLFGSVELAHSPQLVAFVPERSQNRAGSMADGTAQAAQSRQVDIAYQQVQQLRSVRRSAQAGPDAREMNAPKGEARVPSSRAEEAADRRGEAQPAAVRQEVAFADESRSNDSNFSNSNFSKSNSGMPHAVLLKAEMPNRSAAPSHEKQVHEKQGEQQQWIVMTTWEQLETSSLTTGAVADYDSGARAAADDGTNMQRVREPMNQITITRLIFRIVPANSVSTHQAPALVRSGWFVLQL